MPDFSAMPEYEYADQMASAFDPCENGQHAAEGTDCPCNAPCDDDGEALF